MNEWVDVKEKKPPFNKKVMLKIGDSEVEGNYCGFCHIFEISDEKFKESPATHVAYWREIDE